jgi:hypothetical protein
MAGALVLAVGYRVMALLLGAQAARQWELVRMVTLVEVVVLVVQMFLDGRAVIHWVLGAQVALK